MTNIKISIITITFNSEKTIRDTLESVRKQFYPNLEYIVIDGLSTDNTLQIVNDYSDIVTHIVSEKDKGIGDAMNKGISLATGDLIGIIHSDDALYPGALDFLNKVWDGVSDVYYGNALIINKNGRPKHVLKSAKDLSNMPFEYLLVHPATFVTKKCYNEHGVFNINYKCAMDYELFLRFYNENVTFKYIDAILSFYREGGTNMVYRNVTIDEVCDISIKYGANPKKAKRIRKYKKLKVLFHPLISFLKLKNKRVYKYENH